MAQQIWPPERRPCVAHVHDRRSGAGQYEQRRRRFRLGVALTELTREVGAVVAAVPDRLSRAVPFNPLKPFDRRRFANLVAPRRCAAAHFPPLLGTGAMRKSFTARARTSIGRKSSPFSRTRPQPGLSLW